MKKMMMFFSVAAMLAAHAATHWWEEPEVTKTVTLAAAAQSPQSIACDADGRYVALWSSGGDMTAAFSLRKLIRRTAAIAAVSNSTVSVADFSDSVAVGGRSLRYYGKVDGKVYVAEGQNETALVDLSGSGTTIVQTKVARSTVEGPCLHVLLGTGSVCVYVLAADGLSLASSAPVATVDVGALGGIGTPALIDVSPDGLALFATTVQGDSLHVIRSSKWGLVDCVSPTVLFPWRNDAGQTTATRTADVNTPSKPDQSASFAEPYVYPWAEQSIYSKVRWVAGNITNTFSNLTAGDAYRVEYHCAENGFTAANKRVFSLLINDVPVHEDIDPYVAGGSARGRAFAEAYGTTATTNGGQIVCVLVKNIDNPIYCGYAVWGRELPEWVEFGAEFATDGSTGTLTWNAIDTLAYHVQSAPSREGPWTTILVDQTAKTLAVSPGAANAVYYRVVASNGVGVVASAARCSKPEKYTVYAINCGHDPKRHGRFAPSDHLFPNGPVVDDNNIYGQKTSVCADNEHSIPAAVAKTAYYYSRTYGPLEYRFPNLNPGRTYDVRVYCLESAFAAPGKRVFSACVNGTTVRAGIDPFAQAGKSRCVAEFVCPGVSPKADGSLDLSFVAEVDYVDLSAIEIVENDSPRVPLMPVVRGAYMRNNGVHVAVASGTGELAYDVRRRPASGGAYETVATGVADTACLDVGGTAGYVYSVRAMDAQGSTGEWSADVAVMPTGQGPEAFIGISPQKTVEFSNENGVYRSYAGYSRYNISEAAQSYSHDIVLDPAPADLYKRIAYTSSLCLVFTNLYPSANYRLRLQAIESYFTARGKRVTSWVYANSEQIYGAFDAYCEVGKGVFPIEAVVKATPEGKVYLLTTQTKNSIDFCTVELFLQDGKAGGGVARAVRSGSNADPAWSQDVVQTLDLSGVPAGVPATGNEFIWDAMLSVPADGDYAFDVAQGGDYALWIDDAIVLSATNGAEASGTVTLGMGDHHLRARYVQGGGAASVALKWAGGTFTRQGIAAAALTRSRTTDLSQGLWRHAEIGTALPGDLYKVGQTSEDGSDVWRLTASGSSTYGSNDQSHYVYREVDASAFEARVRLRNIPNRARYSSFGLTLRTATSSFGGDYLRQVFTAIENPGAASRWYVGSQGGDFTVASPRISNSVTWDLKLPVWHRVRKWRSSGKNLAEFSYSLDNATTWTVCCTNELTATKPILVGVSGCGYTQERLVSYEFDHFELDVVPPSGTYIVFR